MEPQTTNTPTTAVSFAVTQAQEDQSGGSKLLGLAQVAITQLAEEAKARPNSVKAKPLTLKQIQKFGDKKLLSTFSELTKDAKRQHMSYKCKLATDVACFNIFETNNGDQDGIRRLMVEHLKSHLETLEKIAPNVKIDPPQKKTRTVKKSATTATKSYPVKAPPSISVNPITPEKKGIVTIVLAKKTPVKGGSNDKPTESKTNLALLLPQHSQLNVATMGASVVNKDGNNNTSDKTHKDHTYQTTTNKANIEVSSTSFQPQQSQMTNLIGTQEIKTEDVNMTNTNQGVKSQPVVAMIDPMMTPVVIKAEEIDIAQHGELNTFGQTATISAPAMEVRDDPESARMRALALDYIDDIRKKSSSAAKSVIVNGDKSLIYECKLCPDKQFTSTNGLIFHYKKHAGLKPYICELCASTFTRQHSLNYHMLIHMNKSRFICKECGRHFRHPSHFKEHMRRHTGETPFQCSDCLIRFKTRNTYKRHLQTKHSKILTSKGIVQLNSTATLGQAQKGTLADTVASKVNYYGQPTTTKGAKSKAASKKATLQNMNITTEQTITPNQQQHTLMQTAPASMTASGSIQQSIVQIDANGTIYLNDQSFLGAHLVPVSGTTLDGQSIAILNMPTLQTNAMLNQQMLGSNNLIRIQKPLGDLTDNVYNQQQAYTLVPYTTGTTTTLIGEPGTANIGMICGDGNMLLEPVKSIQMNASGMVSTATATHSLQPTILTVPAASDENSANQLTQLTTAISPQMTAGYQTQQVVVATAAAAPAQQQITLPTGQAVTNYNFMKLLEAIELSEEVDA